MRLKTKANPVQYRKIFFGYTEHISGNGNGLHYRYQISKTWCPSWSFMPIRYPLIGYGYTAECRPPSLSASKVFTLVTVFYCCQRQWYKRAPFGKRIYCTIIASPNSQRRYLWFLSALQLKIKGRDCGTINGHDESLSIRPLMKDAREALVR